MVVDGCDVNFPKPVEGSRYAKVREHDSSSTPRAMVRTCAPAAALDVGATLPAGRDRGWFSAREFWGVAAHGAAGGWPWSRSPRSTAIPAACYRAGVLLDPLNLFFDAEHDPAQRTGDDPAGWSDSRRRHAGGADGLHSSGQGPRMAPV
jgi:hypothetical protein